MLDEFEQSAWAGLAPDRYAWAAVQHRTATGGVHVHVARRAVRPGDGQEPQHRAAGLGADLWPAGRGVQPRPRLEPPG